MLSHLLRPHLCDDLKLHQQIERRLEMSGDTSPGQLNLIADLLQIVAMDAEDRVNCQEDVVHIPDVIHEAERAIRARAVISDHTI